MKVTNKILLSNMKKENKLDWPSKNFLVYPNISGKILIDCFVELGFKNSYAGDSISAYYGVYDWPNGGQVVALHPNALSGYDIISYEDFYNLFSLNIKIFF